jgi:ornithine decarboxylase
MTANLLDMYKPFVEDYQGPCLVIDRASIFERIKRFLRAVPNVLPYYAMKANPHPGVLQTVSDAGINFDVASADEILLLERTGLNVRHVLFSNPVKKPSDIAYAAWNGIQNYAIDSQEEMFKILSIVPHAKMYVRLSLPPSTADSPLNDKFGIDLYELEGLLRIAKTVKADICGVTFHVGSQCRYLDSWGDAIGIALKAGEMLLREGFRFELLNLGGGFPVSYTRPIPEIEDIGLVLDRLLQDLPKETRVVAEPGRHLVAESGMLICQVIATSTRKGTRWAYLDVGTYNGLVETIQGVECNFCYTQEGDTDLWNVAGPTCDSNDIMSKRVRLPRNLATGDFLYVPNAGAYSVASASTFCGAHIPEVILL